MGACRRSTTREDIVEISTLNPRWLHHISCHHRPRQNRFLFFSRWFQLVALGKTLGFVKELELQPLGRIADFAILT